MAKLIDIPEDEETSYNLGATALYNLVKEVLPDHELISADANLPMSTTPYITLDPTQSSGFHDNGLGNKPIYHERDELGITTDVYQETCVWRIRSFKGKAFFDLKKVKSSLEQPEIHYKHFGNTGIIGTTSIGTVRRTPAVIDYQKMENSATMLVTLTYLYKNVNGDGFPINSVVFDTVTSTSFVNGEKVEDEVVIEPPYS